MKHVYAIMLNGPRGSGKDHIAKRLSRRHPELFHAKFSAPMKHIVSAALGSSQEELEKIKLDKVYGAEHNKSYVDLQIEMWDWLSKQFGDAVLGIIATSYFNIVNVSTHHYGFVFSDAGRGPEVDVVVNRVGGKNALVVRLHRDGCTFDGDIRNYVTPYCTFFDVANEGTEESALYIIHRIEEWLLRTATSNDGISLPEHKMPELLNIIDATEKASNE